MKGRLSPECSRLLVVPWLGEPGHLRSFSSLTSHVNEEAIGPTEHRNNRTVRVRTRGNESLPLPPILDPAVIEARRRWEQPKERPSHESRNPFQQKLYSNPYANALATPVRCCRITSARVPSAFILSFRPVPHPDTRAPWFAPTGLISSSAVSGPPQTYLCSRNLITHLTSMSRWTKSMSPNVGFRLGRLLKNVVWREDMDSLVLSLLRQSVLQKLRWHFFNPGRRLVSCQTASTVDLDPIDGILCVLYLRSFPKEADELQEKAQEVIENIEKSTQRLAEHLKKHRDEDAKRAAQKAPPWWRGLLVPRLRPRIRFLPLRYMTAEWRGRQVAVYNLHELLGEEKLAELVQGTAFEDKDCVAMRASEMTVKAQLMLMQLQTYMARPGP